MITVIVLPGKAPTEIFGGGSDAAADVSQDFAPIMQLSAMTLTVAGQIKNARGKGPRNLARIALPTVQVATTAVQIRLDIAPSRHLQEPHGVTLASHVPDSGSMVPDLVTRENCGECYASSCRSNMAAISFANIVNGLLATFPEFGVLKDFRKGDLEFSYEMWASFAGYAAQRLHDNGSAASVVTGLFSFVNEQFANSDGGRAVLDLLPSNVRSAPES